MSDAMKTRGEREELSKIVRLPAKVTKARLETLAADRRAEVEAQLSAIQRRAADKLTVLASGTLMSAEAKSILDSLPSPELLLPPIRLTAELDGGVTNPKQLLKMEQ